MNRVLGTECREFDDPVKALKSLLKFGASFVDILDIESDPTLDPISIAMNHHSEEILAILLQKAGAGLSQQCCKELHEIVGIHAVKEVDIELVMTLVEAGTDKQELLSVIKAQRKARNIKKSNAEQLKSILRKKMSLQQYNRIAIWSSLSSLEDITKLRLPMKLVRWLLFEDAETGYAVTDKLTAGNKFYHRF